MKHIVRVSAISFVLLASVFASVPRAMAASPARVQLISAGQSPRSTLRLTVTGSTTAQATTQLSESIKQSVGGQTINSVDSPPITMTIRIDAGAASRAGSMPLSYSYANVDVVNDGSLTAAQVAQYQAALAPVASLTGTGTLTARNQLVNSKIAGTEGLDATTAQIVSQVSDQLAAFGVPFPREAVGIGARWRTTSLLHVGGIAVRQVTEYTLRKREGSQVAVDVKVAQTAPPQRAELPGVPSGTKVRLTKWNGLGTGAATLSLDQPALPLTSDVHISGSQSFDISGQGQHGTMDQKISIDFKVSP